MAAILPELAVETALGSVGHTMRHFPAVVVVAGLALVAGCKKEEITSYKVPKEPAATKGAVPNDHHHAGVGKAPTESAGAPAAGAAAPASAPVGGGSAMANTPVATASGSALTWTGPSHWQNKGATGMRKGTFTIPGDGGATAELAITAFPGDVGGDVANVNRWRGQIGLQPLSPDEAMKAIQRTEANGLKIGVVEMVATTANPKRVLSAIVPHGGSTWFFKLEGPDALVAKEKGAFMEFLKTIKPAGQ